MKTFLLKNNVPTIKFSMIPDNIFFEGKLPGKEYSLALCPTNEKMVIVDIDCKQGKINGYDNVPKNIFDELLKSYNYKTRSGGMHVFLHYTGDKFLKNCATKYSIDLRIGANKQTNNAGGYVRYYPAEFGDDIRNHIEEIKGTSLIMNEWLEKLFS
jgi:hypothetical protein